MTHAWMNLIAALFASFVMNQVPQTEEIPTVHSENTTEYAVVERIDDGEIILETGRGSFSIPEGVLPKEMEKEGIIIEIRMAADEQERRLAKGRERIERMSAQSIVEL